VFDLVRQRIRTASGRMRSRSSAYLAYALLDAVIDAHFPVLEELGERLEVLEDMIVLQPDPTTIAKIHDIKREMRVMRREMWPLREVCGRLSREHLDGIDDDVRLFYRDCYDHTVQIIDLIETYRELGADLTDLFLSSQSNRLNEIMKVLTFIATLFMPLSFIVGIYGMNFNTELPGNMPELNTPYAYVVVWVVMIVATLSMLWFFHREGWIGRRSRIHPK
jgi:magnesium transporter